MPGEVVSHVKLGEYQGGFFGTIDEGDQFGQDLALLGDVDGDGIDDLAVTAPFAPEGGNWRGAVWILFMQGDGTVRDWQKISGAAGGLLSPIEDWDNFGAAIAPLGDWNADGVPDLAVGASGDDDGGSDRGAVYLLMLHADGTVKSETKISDTQGGFTGTLDDTDWFGSVIALLGDLDGDHIPDLAVTNRNDDDGGFNRGAVFVLFMAPDGSVKSHAKISDTSGNLRAELDDLDFFGLALAALGDLDGDGRPDLAVGAPNDSDLGTAHGAVYVLFLKADGSVRHTQKINDAHGGFTGSLGSIVLFGNALAGLGDLDHDGVRDLAVGSPFDNDSDPGTIGYSRGAVYILFLRKNGMVKSHQKISDKHGNFQGVLADGNGFGEGLATLGDIDGNGVVDLAVGADEDALGFGAPKKGAVWLLRLHGSSWTDLGGGLTGAAGSPRLSGLGTLLPGEEVLLQIRTDAPGVPVAIAVSSSAFGLPLPGHTLGPMPDAVIPNLWTDAHGGLEFAFRWPTVAGPGATAYMQAWFPDPTPAGSFTASNLLRATAP